MKRIFIIIFYGILGMWSLHHQPPTAHFFQSHSPHSLTHSLHTHSLTHSLTLIYSRIHTHRVTEQCLLLQRRRPRSLRRPRRPNHPRKSCCDTRYPSHSLTHSLTFLMYVCVCLCVTGGEGTHEMRKRSQNSTSSKIGSKMQNPARRRVQ
jgi:hypothetical protein